VVESLDLYGNRLIIFLVAVWILLWWIKFKMHMMNLFNNDAFPNLNVNGASNFQGREIKETECECIVSDSFYFSRWYKSNGCQLILPSIIKNIYIYIIKSSIPHWSIWFLRLIFNLYGHASNLYLRRVEAKRKKFLRYLSDTCCISVVQMFRHWSKECRKIIFFGHQSKLSNACRKSVIPVSDTKYSLCLFYKKFGFH
jgi:hypothetical protein